MLPEAKNHITIASSFPSPTFYKMKKPSADDAVLLKLDYSY